MHPFSVEVKVDTPPWIDVQQSSRFVLSCRQYVYEFIEAICSS